MGGAAGTFYGACEVAWYPDPIVSTPKGVIIQKTSFAAVGRSLMRPAVWCALAGCAFSAVDCIVESSRNKKDHWNSVAGGMAAGLVVGATTKRFDIMTTTALGMGLLLGVMDGLGGATVADPIKVRHKQRDVLPAQHQESEALKGLKEKYPKFADN